MLHSFKHTRKIIEYETKRNEANDNDTRRKDDSIESIIQIVLKPSLRRIEAHAWYSWPWRMLTMNYKQQIQSFSSCKNLNGFSFVFFFFKLSVKLNVHTLTLLNIALLGHRSPPFNTCFVFLFSFYSFCLLFYCSFHIFYRVARFFHLDEFLLILLDINLL